jgi:hypothetical protein
MLGKSTLLAAVLAGWLASVQSSALPPRTSETPASNVSSTAQPIPVTAQTIASEYMRPAMFSAISYCDADLVTNQTAISGYMANVTVLQSGGDGTDVPMCASHYYILSKSQTDSFGRVHRL